MELTELRLENLAESINALGSAENRPEHDERKRKTPIFHRSMASVNVLRLLTPFCCRRRRLHAFSVVRLSLAAAEA